MTLRIANIVVVFFIVLSVRGCIEATQNVRAMALSQEGAPQ